MNKNFSITLDNGEYISIDDFNGQKRITRAPSARQPEISENDSLKAPKSNIQELTEEELKKYLEENKNRKFEISFSEQKISYNELIKKINLF